MYKFKYEIAYSFGFNTVKLEARVQPLLMQVSVEVTYMCS